MKQADLPLNRPAAVVVFSGGQDSTTCLFWALHHGYRVFPVTFEYGQLHAAEVKAAEAVLRVARACYNKTADIGIEAHEVIRLGPSVLRSTSPLVSGVGLEEYNDAHSLPGKGIEKTFVPMRNQLFLTIAANRAAHYGAKALVTGVCEADYGGYPDCRQKFITALGQACNLGTFTGEPGAPQPITILAPLMRLTKAQSVLMALELPGCYAALAWSHTAYDGKYPPTGKDHASLLRAKGFEDANVPDPLVLRAWNEGRMHLPKTPNYKEVNVVDYLEKAHLI